MKKTIKNARSKKFLNSIKETLLAIKKKDEELFKGVFDFILFEEYRVSDTMLTYRQLNILGVAGLLNGAKENSRGWRKFSFKDLVYLDIVSKLRKYGLEGSQLWGIKDLFYKKESVIDLILMAVLFEAKATIILKSDGSFEIFETKAESLDLESSNDIFIKVNLNEIIRLILIRMGVEKLDYAGMLKIVEERFKYKK